MFDEESGQPIKARDSKGYAKRLHKTPCEASIGCAKGHYNEKPYLNATQEAVSTLYLASRSTGGSVIVTVSKKQS